MDPFSGMMTGYGMRGYGMRRRSSSTAYSSSSSSSSSCASAPASACSKGHGALQDGVCLMCRWEKASASGGSQSAPCSTTSSQAECIFGHGPKGADGCAMCNLMVLDRYATSTESSECAEGDDGESFMGTCSMTSSDGTDAGCSETSSSSGASSALMGDACSQTSSGSSAERRADDDLFGDSSAVCSQTSSASTKKVDSKRVREEWLHRVGSKANAMFLEAYRDALEKPETAGKIAASFLRFHAQATNVEETQNQMLQEYISKG